MVCIVLSVSALEVSVVGTGCLVPLSAGASLDDFDVSLLGNDDWPFKYAKVLDNIDSFAILPLSLKSSIS
jgi:hypothetical protein